jgi:hypothetical protein
MHRRVQVPPLVIGQRALPGDDLHVQQAAGAESPDRRHEHHDVRAAGHCLLNGEHRAVSSAGGPDHGGCSGNPPGARSSPAGNGSKNMTSRYAARHQTAQM